MFLLLLPTVVKKHLNIHEGHHFVFGGEDMHLVYLPAALAQFVDDAQRNVDYTALETELPT